MKPLMFVLDESLCSLCRGKINIDESIEHLAATCIRLVLVSHPLELEERILLCDVSSSTNKINRFREHGSCLCHYGVDFSSLH